MSNIYIYKITNLQTENVYIGIREIDGDIKTDRYKGENTRQQPCSTTFSILLSTYFKD